MVNLLIADDEDIIRHGLLSIEWEKIGVNIVADVDNGLEAVETLQSEILILSYRHTNANGRFELHAIMNKNYVLK